MTEKERNAAIEVVKNSEMYLPIKAAAEYDSPANLARRLATVQTVTDDAVALSDLNAAELAVLYAEASDIAIESIESLGIIGKV